MATGKDRLLWYVSCDLGRHGKARCGEAGCGAVGQARRGEAGLGAIWCGKAGEVRCG